MSDTEELFWGPVEKDLERKLLTWSTERTVEVLQTQAKVLDAAAAGARAEREAQAGKVGHDQLRFFEGEQRGFEAAASQLRLRASELRRVTRSAR